jgi:transcriptional regulator with XRE-family HTH domain
MEIIPSKSRRHLFEQMTIGDRIRYLRELHGYKQAELAMKAGITQAAISNLETDSSRKPSAPTLLRLALALECEPAWLLDGIGDPKAPRIVSKESEQELLEAYRAMPAGAKAALLAAAKAMK